MTWQGRQLTKAVKDKTVTFTYDSEGIRTSKSDGTNTTKYLLNGTQILAQTTNGKTLCFFYDQQGNRVAMADSGNHFYYYIYNLQGDVIALADASTGKLVATYTYDAWGKIVKINGQNPEKVASTNIANINPFRYRGYYYDTETKLYYLQTRYYDPEVGRFINADAFASTDISGVLSANMFAYCENNPVMRHDPTGEMFWSVLASAVGGAAASAAVYMATTGKMDSKGVLTAMAKGALVGALSGVEGKFKAAASIAAGICSGVDTFMNTNGSVAEKLVAGSISGATTAATSYFGAGVESKSGITVGAKVTDTYASAHISFVSGFNTDMISQGAQKIAIKTTKAVKSVFKSVSKAFGKWFGWR